MSKAEILEAIPKLTPEEREEVRQRLDEIDDSLTPEEWALDKRLAEHEADPLTFAPGLANRIGVSEIPNDHEAPMVKRHGSLRA